MAFSPHLKFYTSLAQGRESGSDLVTFASMRSSCDLFLGRAGCSIVVTSRGSYKGGMSEHKLANFLRILTSAMSRHDHHVLSRLGSLEIEDMMHLLSYLCAA